MALVVLLAVLDVASVLIGVTEAGLPSVPWLLALAAYARPRVTRRVFYLARPGRRSLRIDGGFGGRPA